MSQVEMSTCMLRDGVVSVAPRRGEGEWEQAAGRRKKGGGGRRRGGRASIRVAFPETRCRRRAQPDEELPSPFQTVPLPDLLD